MIGMLQRLGVRAPLLLVGGLIVTFILEPVLTMVLVAILPFIGFTVYTISKRGIPLFTGQQEATDEMTRVVRENAQVICSRMPGLNMHTIRCVAMPEYE